MGQAEWASRVAGGADLQDANFGGSEDLTMGQFFTRSNPSKEDSKQKLYPTGIHDGNCNSTWWKNSLTMQI